MRRSAEPERRTVTTSFNTRTRTLSAVRRTHLIYLNRTYRSVLNTIIFPVDSVNTCGTLKVTDILERDEN